MRVGILLARIKTIYTLNDDETVVASLKYRIQILYFILGHWVSYLFLKGV